MRKNGKASLVFNSKSQEEGDKNFKPQSNFYKCCTPEKYFPGYKSSLVVIPMRYKIKIIATGPFKLALHRFFENIFRKPILFQQEIMVPQRSP